MCFRILFLAAFLALGREAAAQNYSQACEDAIVAQEWMLEQYSSDDPEMQQLLGEAIAATSPAPFLDQVPFTTFQSSWAPYNLQVMLSSTPWGGADLAEVQYVVSKINDAWAGLTTQNATVENTYVPWARYMVEQGDRLAGLARNASNGWLPDYRSRALLRAANFYMTSIWPFPAALNGSEMLAASTEAFNEGLDLGELYHVEFEVPFNNGTATTNLSAQFITPDPTAKLPLMVFILGTDTPKESMFLWYGPPLLQADYSLLIFDGPGQGSTVFKPEHMPFFAKSEEYTRDVLEAALSDPDIASKVDSDSIGLIGYSFGGFLGGRACSQMGDVLKACVLTPPVASMAANYKKVLTSALYDPFKFILEANSSLVPEDLQPLFADPGNNILRPLVLDCPADSPAPELFNAPLAEAAQPIDPEFVYSAVGYMGLVTDNTTDIINAQWAALRNILTNFVNPDVNQTTVPVFAAKGTEDDLIGGLEQVYWEQLPAATRERGRFVRYTPETGGALHCQAGALTIFMSDLLPWLDGQLKTNGTAT